MSSLIHYVITLLSVGSDKFSTSFSSWQLLHHHKFEQILATCLHFSTTHAEFLQGLQCLCRSELASWLPTSCHQLYPTSLGHYRSCAWTWCWSCGVSVASDEAISRWCGNQHLSIYSRYGTDKNTLMRWEMLSSGQWRLSLHLWNGCPPKKTHVYSPVI